MGAMFTENQTKNKGQENSSMPCTEILETEDQECPLLSLFSPIYYFGLRYLFFYSSALSLFSPSFIFFLCFNLSSNSVFFTSVTRTGWLRRGGRAGGRRGRRRRPKVILTQKNTFPTFSQTTKLMGEN